MNKHLLSTIAAAMVPIGMSSASVQPPSAYSYLGSRNNKNTTYATSSNTPNVANKYAQQRINENPLALNVNENTDKLTAASLHQLYERGASKKRIRQYRARWLGWVISMMAVAVTARAEDCPQVSFELIDSTSTLVCDPIAFATSYVSGDVLLDEITSSNRILTSSSSSNSLIAGRTYSYTDSTGYDFHGTWSDSGWTSADSGLIPIGSLSTSTSYIDFISLPSTTTSDTAVDMFDFNITDGDGNGDPADGLSLDVTQLMVNVTGTSTDALRGSVTWRLNGDDVGNVEGLYDENSDTITFSGLNISVADGASETYSVNAYMNDANAVTDNATFIFTIDGDTDLTVSSTGTQMGSTDPVSNGVGGMFEVVATKLKYTTVPAGSVSGSSLTTQPVVTAVDAFGNTDVDFSETITLTEASAGSLTGGSVAAVNGVATFAAVNYTATADQQSFVLTANDQDGVDTDLGTVDASAITSTLPLNTAPVISGSPSTTVNDGSTYSFTPTVTDADSGDTKTFNITGTPSWAVFNEATGTLSGSPSNSHIGELSNITITVTDSASAQGSLSFSLEVTERNYAPSISGSPATQVTEGSAYSFRPSVSDANNSDSHTFSISGKPSWASFSTSNGRLSGTPTVSDVGVSGNIVITVTDSASASARLNSFSIEVVNKNTAPVVSAQSVSVVEDEALTIVLSGTDAEDDSVSLSIVSLPTHGSLTANTAENSWTYEPDANYAGSDNFTYKANDGDVDSAIASVDITITPVNDAPVAVDDSFDVEYNGSGAYTFDVLVNDIDVDEDSLTLINASSNIGVVSVVDGQLSFERGNVITENVTLSYAISDGTESAKAKVNVTFNNIPTEELPIVTAPADIDVNATGLYTKVDLGVATAVDSNGALLAVSLVDGVTTFSPGNHVVYWQATDANGLTTIATQNVAITPLITIGGDSISGEGTSHRVEVQLNGDSPTYPVTIGYSVDGTMDASDHDLTTETLVIAQGKSGTINFNVLADSIDEDAETLTITLDNGESYTLTVVEQNIAPMVSYTITQDGEARSVIEADAGDVVIEAHVNDANIDDTHTYDWSSETGTGVDAIFTMSTVGLAQGIEQIKLTVTDSGDTPASTITDIYVNVTSTLPVLTNIDTDGDLIPDAQEGLGDNDNDGIPNYLDVATSCNVMPAQVSETETFLIEGTPGVCLRKGSTVVNNTLGGLEINPSELATDEQVSNVGGLFDFIAYGLPTAGQTYKLVLPQISPIPAGATYRKYSVEKDWFEFVVDSNNSYSSSKGRLGYCPPPADSSWTSGLTEGHWCVRLTIEDGGPNDDDGEANGVIVDPGGVGVWISQNTAPQVNDESEVTTLNTPLTIDVLSNDVDADNDSLTLQSASVDFGVVEILNEQLTYTPPLDFLGVAKISYGISDNNGGTGFATVTVSVVENEAPTTVDDEASTDDSTAITVGVLVNDSDVNGDSLTIIAVSAEQGSVVINSDGTLTYTPELGFEGVDVVTYTVDDGQGGQAIGTLSVTVTLTPVESKSSGGMGVLIIGLISLSLFRLRRRGISKRSLR